MSNYILVIDGGTTNTRFTLIDDAQTIDTVTKKIGASDTKDSTRNISLEEAVREAVGYMENTHNCRIHTILAAGMITSNVGLKEVPHLQAPIRLRELARQIVPCRLPEVCPHGSFYFVPGIKFGSPGESGCDILRGEETEIYGAVPPGDEDKRLLFLHFGSHNKSILYENGSITKAVTTIGGELLWALANHTILKSSVGSLDDCKLEEEHVRMGYESAQQHSVSRTLFMARIHQVLGGLSKAQALSFVYGVLVQSDLSAFAPLLATKPDKLVLYGRSQFAEAFTMCLRAYGPRFEGKIETLGFEESEQLSIKGLTRIHRDLEKLPPQSCRVPE